ncbi:reelin domain-containing protein [Trichonephila clavipes]|nr:reelin domain-containing protein [Trichonephila clavipes]
MLKTSLVIFIVVLHLASGWPTGAPSKACEAMLPKHGSNRPQPAHSSPYSFVQSAESYRPGDQVIEESDDECINLDDEIDDLDFQDPAHNLQSPSDSDKSETDIDHDTLPQNTKNSDALSDTDTASLSSVDEMSSANVSGCRPILWFHAHRFNYSTSNDNSRRVIA